MGGIHGLLYRLHRWWLPQRQTPKRVPLLGRCSPGRSHRHPQSSRRPSSWGTARRSPPSRRGPCREWLRIGCAPSVAAWSVGGGQYRRLPASTSLPRYRGSSASHRAGPPRTLQSLQASWSRPCCLASGSSPRHTSCSLRPGSMPHRAPSRISPWQRQQGSLSVPLRRRHPRQRVIWTPCLKLQPQQGPASLTGSARR